MKGFEIRDNMLVKYRGTAKEVTIPDGVGKIGARAFFWSRKSMKAVTIPASVKEIAGDKSWMSGAFHGCESLEQVVLSEGLEIIGPYSFYECKSLKSITIPSSVKEVGEGAFYQCDSLGQVVLCEGLEKIGGDAFCFCHSLKSITIPASVKKIEHDAFSYGDRLNSITFEGAAPKLGNNALGEVEVIYAPHASAVDFPQNKEAYLIGFLQMLKEGVVIEKIVEKNKKNIKQNAQKLCGTKNEELFVYMLRNALIPLNVVDEFIAKNNEEKNLARVAALIDYKEKNFTEEQKEEQFNKQFELREPTFAELRKIWTFSKKEDGTYRISGYKGEEIDVNVPSIINGIKVTEIGDGKLFYGSNNHFFGGHASKVRTITLQDGIETIAAHTFSCCGALKSITIPASVKEIGREAFWGCRSLESVMLPERLEYVGDDAFFNCKSPLKLKEKNGFLFIGTFLYAYVGDESEVEIPDDIKIIGSRAFVDKHITKISLLAELKQIGGFAFCDCKLLNTIKIPDSVKSIGEYAFGGCSDITIYVRCRKRPEGWDDDWNRNGWQGKKVKVVWGYKGE